MSEEIQSPKPKLKHVFEQCSPRCPHDIYCAICEGDVQKCGVCNCVDGFLTTDCPGYTVFLAVQEAINKGILDYVDGLWINPLKPRPAAKPAPTLTLVGTFAGSPLYADTSMKPGEWKLVQKGLQK